MGQERSEPCFIELCLLAGRLPEGTDFLFLAPGSKSLSRDGQGNQRFEVLGGGIGEAGLPSPPRFGGDAKPLGQTRLRQPSPGAQGQDGLSKGVVSLTIEGYLHERALSVSPTHT